jgi:hypothetical protein
MACGGSGRIDAQRDEVLRCSYRRLSEALRLDPANQHARTNLETLRQLAVQLGINLSA